MVINIWQLKYEHGDQVTFITPKGNKFRVEVADETLKISVPHAAYEPVRKSAFHLTLINEEAKDDS